MAKIMFSWLGDTDIKACSGELDGRLGPIAGAINDRGYKSVYILSCRSKKDDSSYCDWLKNTVSIEPVIKNVKIKHPMDFNSIYEAAQDFVKDIQSKRKNDEIVFALSPGTPAMAAVWIILAKTVFLKAELIESSVRDDDGNYHIRTASADFEISANFIMDVLLVHNEKLKALMASLPPLSKDSPDIIYKCPQMERAIALARHAAIRNVPVLLLGESGTGKELFAGLIHKESLRGITDEKSSTKKDKEKYFPVNCGALSPELIESQLFGHVKGAFTGAVDNRTGYFVQANNGTLFLDEIGDMNFNLQVKLLRAIQEKKIMPLGSNEQVDVDVRIIAATHKNLIEEVAKGNFRDDLFYRLAVAVIHIPPLRERGKDISLLIDFFMKRINSEFSKQPDYKGPKFLSPSARKVLENHHWPGNVRELENTLKRAAIWKVDEKIDKQDVLDSIIPIVSKDSCGLLDRPLGPDLKINKLMDELAKHYLERALDKAGGNKTKASKLIGLENHQNFTNWMKKHGVDS